MRTDRLQQEYGVGFRWNVYPLHPETPEEGMELSRLFADSRIDIEIMQTRLSHLAAVEGLPLTERTRICNSRRAQELGKWAESRGVGDQFRRAVYRAYFVDGCNIALVDELMRIVESIGLPVNEAREVLAAHSFAAAVDADWKLSMGLRINAVPTYLYNGKRLEGFSSYDDYVRLIGEG